jgi:hypothetical protein
MLVIIDQFFARPFIIFSSKPNIRFLLSYEFHGGKVKLFSTDEDMVLLESELFLLNASNGCMKLLTMPSEPFTLLTLEVLVSSSFQIQIIGMSRPSPFNLRLGYSEGGIWEEEQLPNNLPFEQLVITGSNLFEDELYCLGVDGSIGRYGRERWRLFLQIKV